MPIGDYNDVRDWGAYDGDCNRCGYHGPDFDHPGHCCMCGGLHASTYTCEPVLKYTIDDCAYQLGCDMGRLCMDPTNEQKRYDYQWWLHGWAARLQDAYRKKWGHAVWWRIRFHGKRIGALGISSDYEHLVRAETKEEAQLRAYDTHEHIAGGHRGVEAIAISDEHQSVLEEAQAYANRHSKQLVVLCDIAKKYVYRHRYDQNGQLDHGNFAFGSFVCFIDPAKERLFSQFTPIDFLRTEPE